jgi:hypothetical protein
VRAEPLIEPHLLLENVVDGCSFLDYLRKLVFLTWQWLVRVTSVTRERGFLAIFLAELCSGLLIRNS